jgi:hypothetical protein
LAWLALVIAIAHHPAMLGLCFNLLATLRSILRTRTDLAIENLALRQQLVNLLRTSDRPRLRASDRAFWVLLSRFWSHWTDVLVVVKPDTVIAWGPAEVWKFFSQF